MRQTLKIRRSMLGAIVAAALGPAAVMGLPGQASANEPEEQKADIFTTQIPVEGSDIASGRAVVVVDKPIEEVLPVILDYANYVRFMPNFTHSKVLAQRGNRAMVYMEVSVAKGMYTLYGQLNLAEHANEGQSRVVEGRLLEGNINAFNASFKLTPVDGGTRTEIDFHIYVDPDIPLPSSVFSRENERAAGRAVRALRARIVEARGGSA
jgi:ribosome-associated toxin RatA of RatAB toxin-antitoxin module